MPVTKVKVNGEWIPAMPVGGGGEGDMTKAVYDTNDDGVVNAADQATKDGSGNVITSTYAAKATTLSGYGITDAKIQNGSIILGSNSITPLTSFTETDPTVPAWAKAASKPTYTAAEVNAIPTSAKGAANGVAELDSNGLVPTSQLPSYVDDVLEYNAKSSFPSTGETGKIYVDTSTNLTYRWSGSAYVEISPSLALGTTSSTAFRGDYGNAAYAHAVTNKGSAFSSGLYKITTNSEGHVTAAVAVTASDIPDLSSIYLTSETDPVFTASAAHGISSSDITNWNNKSNTDEKVKQESLNGSNSGKNFLFTSSLQTTDNVTSTITYGRYIRYNDYSQSLTLISRSDSTKTSSIAYDYFSINNGTYSTYLRATTPTADRLIYLPDKGGTVALASTTLAGYGITDAKIQNGTITLGSNTITPLTSYTETDPIFTASAAYGITSSDITNWDSKTSNQGTITKVKTTAGAHTTIEVSAGEVSFKVPTNTSHLTNDSGFITASSLSDYIASDEVGKVYVSDTEPSTSNNYDIWIDTSTTLQNANGVMV